MIDRIEFLRLMIVKKEAEAALLDMNIDEHKTEKAYLKRIETLKAEEEAAIVGIASLIEVDAKAIRRIFDIVESQGCWLPKPNLKSSAMSADQRIAVCKEMERRGFLLPAQVPGGPKKYIPLEDRQTSVDRISDAAAKPAACEDCDTTEFPCESTPDKCELLNPKGGDISEAGDTASSGRDLIDVIDRDA